MLNLVLPLPPFGIFNIGPYGKNVSKRFFSETLGQLKPNCPGMIIGRSSTKCLFFMPIGNP
jgi:hypothetical protein